MKCAIGCLRTRESPSLLRLAVTVVGTRQKIAATKYIQTVLAETKATEKTSLKPCRTNRRRFSNFRLKVIVEYRRELRTGCAGSFRDATYSTLLLIALATVARRFLSVST